MSNNFLQKLAYYDGQEYLKKSLADNAGQEQPSNPHPKWVMDVKSGGARGGAYIESNQVVAHSMANINFNDPMTDPSMVHGSIKSDAMKKLINEYAKTKKLNPSMVSFKAQPKLEWYDDKQGGQAYVKATCPVNNFSILGSSLGDQWKQKVKGIGSLSADEGTELLKERFNQIDAQKLDPNFAQKLKQEAEIFISFYTNKNQPKQTVLPDEPPVKLQPNQN